MANDQTRCIQLSITVEEAADLLREGWSERYPAPDIVAELYCLLSEAMGDRLSTYRLSVWAGWGDCKARKFLLRRPKAKTNNRRAQ